MAANLPPEYYSLEREYSGAKSREEKLVLLDKMIASIPKHKSSESIIGDLKRKISLLKKEMEMEVKRKKSLSSSKDTIKKEGAGQVVLIGFPNTGKSYLMNKYCNKHLASTSIAFETKKPEVGMLNYKGVLIQMIEIPSATEGFYEKRGELRGLIFGADVICFVIKEEGEVQKLISEIDMRNRPYITIKSTEEHLGEKLWSKLGMIRVYTKSPGKEAENRPIPLRVGAKVKELAKEIHKHFIDKFNYARVIKISGKVREKTVGLDYVLEDDDTVEFHLK